MGVDIVHLPNFRTGVSTGSRKDDIRDLLCAVRRDLNCTHISHVARTRMDETVKAKPRDLSVVMTFPTKWLFHSAEKNYFSFDTIRKYNEPLLRGEIPGTIRDLGEDGDVAPEVLAFVRDGEKQKLGNLYLNVTATNVHGFLGSTLFIFSVSAPDRTAFKETIRPALVKASHLIHSTLYGTRQPTPGNRINPLTKREIDCLSWAAVGKTDSEIADILQIARWTVVTYLQNARVKLGCSNRTATVATALSLGMIDLVNMDLVAL